VPAADDHLGHAGDVSHGRSGQEADEYRLVPSQGGQDQQRGGRQERSDGYPAAVTHVTHVINHP
jgi:hypothetical protein